MDANPPNPGFAAALTNLFLHKTKHFRASMSSDFSQARPNMAAFTAPISLPNGVRHIKFWSAFTCNICSSAIQRRVAKWSMMAKYQRREESESKGDAGLLRDVQQDIPTGSSSFAPKPTNPDVKNAARGVKRNSDGSSSKVSLPTLSSLGGLSEQPNFGPINDLDIIPERLAERKQQRERSYKKSIMEEQETLESFILGVYEEFKLIEWPPANKVIKITLVVLGAIIFSFFYVYLLDGLFARLAESFFSTTEPIK